MTDADFWTLDSHVCPELLGHLHFLLFFLFHNHTTPTYKRRHTSYLLQTLPWSQTSEVPNKATSQKISDRKLLRSEHPRTACVSLSIYQGFPHGSNIKKSQAMQETPVRSLGQEDSLEKGMATHSSILAWRIAWTEEPGGLQSVGSQTVRHN